MTSPLACGRTEPGLALNAVHVGDCANLLRRITPGSIDLSVWSPPYFVGKSYEADATFLSWTTLLDRVLHEHGRIIKPGGFVAVNLADILCFADPSLPQIQADVIGGKRSPITREQILTLWAQHPSWNRRQIAAALGCSEQTVQRRTEDNNVRGGKHTVQTRVLLTGGIVEQAARDAGLVLYDRRVWHKDPAWANSRWANSSYRAVDEFEHVYIFWKPGITRVDRARLTAQEWKDWGSRAVWQIPSVRANDNHEAKFPIELPRRLIRLLSDPGDVVLDPFLGSGTTAAAAAELGRRWLGIERLPHYAEAAARALGVTTVEEVAA